VPFDDFRLEILSSVPRATGYQFCASSCPFCCGEDSEYADPDPIELVLGWFSSVSIDRDNGCNGIPSDITGDFTSWNSSNTGVAKVTTAKAQGVGVGNATGYIEGTVDGPGQCACSPHLIEIEVPITVTPSLTISGITYVPLRNSGSTGQNSMTVVASGSPSGGTYSWSTTSSNVTLSNTSSATVTVTASAASSARGDTPITVLYKVNEQSASATVGITVVKPTSLSVMTDTTSPSGHTCVGNLGTSSCPQSTFAGTGSYSSYLRTRTYKVMDQFSPPAWIQVYDFEIAESYTQPTGACAGAEVSIGGGTGNTVNDCFFFCDATCKAGGSCGVSATQTFMVNGYSVATENVGWTCSAATVTP
jgi:hypothetical protein